MFLWEIVSEAGSTGSGIQRSRTYWEAVLECGMKGSIIVRIEKRFTSQLINLLGGDAVPVIHFVDFQSLSGPLEEHNLVFS
jgi:hypothetical protein